MAVSGPTIAAYVGAGTAIAGTAIAVDQNRKTENRFKDQERDRLRVESEAVQRASAKTQMARKALKANSLFTGGGDSGAGRTTLGV